MDEIPVFLSSDNNYAMMAAATIKSCINNTKSFINFYILSDGISKENQNKISALQSNKCTMEFIPVNNDVFKLVKTDSYVSLATYSRLLIPQIKPNLKKIIYSDVDVLFMGDIAELYNENLDNSIIGACQDAYYVFEKNLNNIYTRLKLNPEHNYMYAGLLLIDCEKWLAENITEKIFTIMHDFEGRIKQGDQDLLNICFNGNKYKELDIKYEITNGYIHYYDKLSDKQKHSVDNPVIRHYESQFKPWNNDFVFGGPMRNVQEWFDTVRETEFAGDANTLLHGVNISFIIQGEFNAEITPHAIKAIRRFFPGAEIVIGTYIGLDTTGLDYDKIVLVADPGFYLYDDQPDSKLNNINRQIQTTLAGLKVATRKYAFKIRSDFILNGHDFLSYFNQFLKYDPKYKIFEKKILASVFFSRDPRSTKYHLPLPFHPSDIAFFGLRTDLLNLFDIPLMPKEEALFYKLGNITCCRYVPEQYLWINCLRKNNKEIQCDHLHHCDEDIAEESERYTVSNFIYLDYEQFNLTPPKKLMLFSENVFESVITYVEWQALYKEYVDNDHELPKKDEHRRRIKYKCARYKTYIRILNFFLCFIPFRKIRKNLRKKFRKYVAGMPAFRPPI